jgi:UDP-N-acetylmuramoyl-L-alanyl-D-glutamate--2,6-diaminopimelate ligase
MKQHIKQLLGAGRVRQLRNTWHGIRSLFTAFSLLLPATKLKVIGITGTKGKTTTTVFLGRLLNALGIKTGFISTALIYLGTGKEEQNPFKMTTIDPVKLQRYLKTMQYVGCKAVVLEMSSQGLESNRHVGLFGFDYAVFLNLYPEHLDAHGSLENYIACKAILFENLRQGGTAIVNGEAPESTHMLGAIPESVGRTGHTYEIYPSKDVVTSLNDDQYTLSIVENGHKYPTQYFSPVEVLDFYWAAKIAEYVTKDMGVPFELGTILSKSSETGHVPGRMDFAAHSKFADALVDYAHEPESMEQLLKMVSEWKARGLYTNIIHIVSCDGVGRDDWKKEKLGDLSASYADYSYLTTDNYEEGDDPLTIINLLAKNIPVAELDKSVYKVTDRFTAMKQAFSKAKLLKGRTLIVSTGVGNEFGLTRPSGKIEWNEKQKWKEVFSMLGKER